MRCSRRGSPSGSCARLTPRTPPRRRHDCTARRASCMVAAALPRAVAEPYPPGLYGRALLTAQLLERTFGWPTVRELAHPGAPAQRADLTAWLRSLGAREQLARSVLGFLA